MGGRGSGGYASVRMPPKHSVGWVAWLLGAKDEVTAIADFTFWIAD